MPSQAQKIDTVQFLTNLREKHGFDAKTRDGSEVELTLTEPTSMDAARVNRTINVLADSTDKYIIANNLVRFACVKCIDGIDSDNVVPFLRQLPTMPPIPPVIRRCFELLGISNRAIAVIESSLSEESLLKQESVHNL